MIGKGCDQLPERMILLVHFAIKNMYTNVFLMCNIEDGIRAALNSMKQGQIKPTNDKKYSQLLYIYMGEALFKLNSSGCTGSKSNKALD